jgi:hypothetical protein
MIIADDPESVIVAAATRLDNGNFPLSQVHFYFTAENHTSTEPGIQVGIQFVQVGDSREATRYLQDLDDQLACRRGMRVSLVTNHCQCSCAKIAPRTLWTLLRIMEENWPLTR